MSEKKEDCVNCGDQQVPPMQQPPDGSQMPPQFPSFMDAPWEDPKDDKEENWRFMTILNIPWHEASKITDRDDRDFLVSKAKEIEGYLKYQQMMQMQQQQMMQQQQANPQQGQTPLVPPPDVEPQGENS